MKSPKKHQAMFKASLFQLGRVVATPGALELLDIAGVDGYTLVRRHQTGDWGSLCDEDAEQNKLALESGARILSSYEVVDGSRIWIITEADRQVTTLLLPSEY